MHIEMLTGRTTLDDFYGPGGYLESVQRYPKDGAMLALIQTLRAVESPVCAYGMTHTHELGLRARDDERALELIKVRGSSEYGYFVEFLLPEDQAPWPYAWVTGNTLSLYEARGMVLTAMRRSGGWAGL